MATPRSACHARSGMGTMAPSLQCYHISCKPLSHGSSPEVASALAVPAQGQQRMV